MNPKDANDLRDIKKLYKLKNMRTDICILSNILILSLAAYLNLYNRNLGAVYVAMVIYDAKLVQVTTASSIFNRNIKTLGVTKSREHAIPFSETQCS